MKRALLAFSILAFSTSISLCAEENLYKQMSNAPAIQYGFCRPNLSWLGAKNNWQPILDGIKESGAKAVQLNFRENSKPTYEQIAHCNKIELPVNLEIMPLETFVKDGSQKRDGGGKLWNAYGISQIDLQKFSAIFSEWVKELKKRNLRIESFEVFNEINWADFNGDLAIVQGGAAVTEKNYKKYPFALKYIEGMVTYSKVLDIIRKTIETEYTPQKTELPKPLVILGSFVFHGDSNWFAKINSSVIDSDFHFKVLAGKIPEANEAKNVFKNVDGYAVHIYPEAKYLDVKPSTADKTAEKAIRRYIDPIFKEAPKDKLVCITEFSYSSWHFRNEKNPQQARADQTKAFLRSLSKNSLKDINWGFIFHYCYDDDNNWGAIAKDGEVRRPILDVCKEEYPRMYRTK